MAPRILHNQTAVFVSATILRIALLLWSKYQDTHSPVKYTDIDYFVFTDASRFIAAGRSPYERETYRYTPLLAWLLLPTTRWFEFGKALFAAADILAGWLLVRILREEYRLDSGRAVAYASVWLLNPMVAGISTRGSCEGLLGVLAAGLLLATFRRKIALAGIILGFAVHFKIYPFIYGPSLIFWLKSENDSAKEKGLVQKAIAFCNRDRLLLVAYSLSTFMFFNLIMYSIYGAPYLEHSWLHHLTRLDHRHNFSLYNTLLHMNSSPVSQTTTQLERLAFLPQIFLSAFAIPLALSKKDLSGAMLCQTFAFVAFNKVCTSQYFLWYLIFLPIYLPNSHFVARPAIGLLALMAWVLGQAYWLYEGYKLEFLGQQAFVPGLWQAGLAFFAVNCWVLSLIIDDVSKMPKGKSNSAKTRNNG